MLKQLLANATPVFLLLAVSAPALANAQEAIPVNQIAQTSQAKIAPGELEKFANAFVRVQLIERQAQATVVQTIAEQGFSRERIQAIVEARRAEVPLDPPLTAEEKEKIQVINSQASTIWQQAGEQMKAVVENQGLEVDRYEEIFALVRENPSLQEEVKSLVEEVIEEISAEES